MDFTLFCSFHTTALVVLGAGLELVLSGQVQSSCIQLLSTSHPLSHTLGPMRQDIGVMMRRTQRMYFTLFCSFHTTALVVLGAGLVLVLSGQVQSSCIQLLPPMFGVDPPATPFPIN
jgi:hypothetical protein